MASIAGIFRLGGDPVSRDANGKTATSVNVADNTGYGDKQTTNWYTVSSWEKQGEFLAKHFKKGDQIFITGELSQRKYNDKEGNERLSVEIRPYELKFAGAKQAAVASTPEPVAAGKDDDDLPF